MAMTMTKVKVYKNGYEVGWYKDLVPGINSIKATCENMGYDLKEYELRDYEDEKKVLWSGIEIANIV